MKKAATKRAHRAGLGRCLVGGSGLLLLLAGSVQAAPPQLGPRLWRPRAAALPDTAIAPPLPADAATQPPLRRPAAGRLQELRGQRAFQYVEAKAVPVAGRSLWQRLLGWLWEQLGELLDTEDGHTAGNIIFYGIMGAALVFAVLKLLQVDLTRVFGRAPRALPLDYEAGAENIHELNFDDALTQAETIGNLRLAVRLGYLQLLKQLTDRALIDWQPDKTNQTYGRELEASRPAARPAFGELTRQFEYAWYGELPVSAALYRQVREAQQQFGQQLSGAKAARF